MESLKGKKNIFITGKVGIGKTTLIKEVTLPFREQVGGFFTEEIIKDGGRHGFLLRTFSGKEAVLASRDIKGGPRISKYRVDLSTIDDIGVCDIADAIRTKKIAVVDEVGSMEILSKKFRDIFIKSLTSQVHVLATVREKSQPFSDEIKAYPDSAVLQLDRDNFAEIKESLREWIKDVLKDAPEEK